MIKDEVLDAMVAAGATAEMIVAAVKADRQSRSSGAVRQARYRDRKRNALRNGDVTERNAISPLKEPPHTPQENNPPLATSSLRSEAAPPREEDETASHSNELDRLTAKCANALGRAAPADFVIGPMAMLVNAFGEVAVLKTLASEARRPRRKPIRTWQLWADIVREQLENAPKPIPPPAPGEEPIRYYAGQTMPANRLEIAIRRWTVDPSGWISAWGPTPPNNPELIKFAAERGIILQREDAA